MNVVIVATVSDNLVIGMDNSRPWNLPDNKEHFRALTFMHCVAMGRVSYESFGYKLPFVKKLVYTRSILWSLEDLHVVPSVPAIFNQVKSIKASDPNLGDDLYVIGGQQIYEQMIPLANQMWITHVHGIFEGNAFFPEIDMSGWDAKHMLHHGKDEKHTHSFDIVKYTKK